MSTFRSLRIKNSMILIGVIVPLLVTFLTYDIYRQTNSMKKALIRRGTILAQTGAGITSKILADAVKDGTLTEKQLFDKDYKLIPNTSPPKYHTAYDTFTDKRLREIEDSFLRDEMIVFAVAVDTNGYLPTHNTKFSKTGGGLGQDRSKRLFDDPVGNAAARNKEPSLFQEYHRDTGEVMWDISSPIYVNNKHWGAFRIGFSIDQTNKTVAAIRNQIIGGGAVVLLALVLLTVYISGRISSPVIRLAREANLVAQGDLSARDFTSTNLDEVGNLVRSFDNMVARLRDLAEKTRFSAGLIGTFSRELRESTEKASGTAGLVSSSVSQIKDSIREIEDTTQSIVQVSERTSENLAQANAGSKRHISNLDKSSIVLSRATDAVDQLLSQVDKVGSIIQFVTILTEQAGQIAQKAARQAEGEQQNDAEFKELAEEIQSRSREAASAISGISGLFEGVRDLARRAAKSLEQDREIITEGNKVAHLSAEALAGIATDMETMSRLVKEIVTECRQVIGSLNNINQAVEEQTGLVLQFGEATSTLETVAGELEETLSGLKV